MSPSGVMDRSGRSPERDPRRGATQDPQDELNYWMRHLTLGQQHLVASIQKKARLYLEANTPEQRSQHAADLAMYHGFCKQYQFHKRLVDLLFAHHSY